MRFDPPLTRGTLVRRYKRFLADVVLEDGDPITVHCPNTGSMLGVAEPGCGLWLLHHDSPTRRYPWAWELTELADGTLAGINTQRGNTLVREAIAGGALPSLAGYSSFTAEARYGAEGSRIDWLLQADGHPDCYVEVKNVTAAVQDGIAVFPDAVSARGTKHLRELMGVVRNGSRAVLVFCVQRGDVTEVRPADDIDPLYGRTLREALDGGVEVMAVRARITPASITLEDILPFRAP
jgi:sugar fermentation stimulation protein A